MKLGPVFLFYWFLLVLVWISPIDTSLFIKVLSTFILFVIATLVFLGEIKGRNLASKETTSNNLVSSLFKFSLTYKNILLVVICQIVLVIYAGRYYTGLDPLTAISMYFSGVATYANYQQWFADNSLADFSLLKIPPILALGILKLTFILILARLIVYSRERGARLISKICLMCLPIILFSIYRGTSFELFDIGIAMLCFFHLRWKAYRAKQGAPRLELKNYIYMVIFVILLLGVYNYNVLLRYNFDYTVSCSNEFCLEKDSLLYTYSPSFALLLFKMSSYFYFGLDYLSRLTVYLFDDLSRLLSFIFPFQGALELNLYPKFLCHETNLKCGPTWSPRLEKEVLNLGLLFTSLLVMFTGLIYGFIEKQVQMRPDVEKTSLYFFVSLYLISLPVGDFLFVSSANLFALLVLLLIIFLKRVRF